MAGKNLLSLLCVILLASTLMQAVAFAENQWYSDAPLLPVNAFTLSTTTEPTLTVVYPVPSADV